MAAVELTITGVLYDKLQRTVQSVVLIGEASYTGLGPGGGPIVPPGQPPGIWGGGNVPMPTPPIPIYPGGTPNPPGIWGPTDPRPGWGLPEPPTAPPVDGTDKPPPAEGGWAYVAEWNAWGYFPMQSGAAPKRP